jgi:hypothetical protein
VTQTYVPPPPPPPPPVETVAPPPPVAAPKPVEQRVVTPAPRPAASPQRLLRPPLVKPARAFLAVGAVPRVASVSPVAIGPDPRTSRIVPVLLLVLVLFLPALALGVAIAPGRMLPEGAAMRVEQRRETLVTLGLVSAVGALIGVAIVLVGL